MIASTDGWLLFVLAWGCWLFGLVSLGIPGVARADLDEYVKKPDSAFAWSQTSSVTTGPG